MGRKSRKSRTASGQASGGGSKPTGQRFTGWRKWALRGLLALGVPLILLGLVETGLRLFGYGYRTSFFRPVAGREGLLTQNREFTRSFFPPSVVPEPPSFVLPSEKPPQTFRVFVLGGSAAQGSPDSDYSFARVLDVMLEQQFPELDFEVINAAMTAVNSHVMLPVARACAEQRPDAFIVYMGNNEIVGPYGAGSVFRGYSPSLAIIRLGLAIRRLRLGQLLHSIGGALAGSDGTTEWRGMETFAGNLVPADDPRLDRIYAHFRTNLRDICRAADGAGADVLLCTVATNLRDCPPFASWHRQDLQADALKQWRSLYDQGVADEAAELPSRAAGHYRAAAAIDDCHSELHFRLARCLLLEGRIEEAREHYSRARELDALRFRATDAINGSIRRVASEAGAYLVDVEEAFADDPRSVHRLAGNELFYEHVHLNFAGNCLLARTVLKELRPLVRRRTGHQPSREAPTDADCELLLALTPVDRSTAIKRVLRGMARPPFTAWTDIDRRRKELRERLRGLRAEETPTGLLRAAETYRQALGTRPDDPILHLNFADLQKLRGHTHSAVTHYRRVVDLLPVEMTAHASLGALLTELGQYDTAAHHLRIVLEARGDSPVVEHLLGRLHQRQEQYELAARRFRRAISLGSKLPHTHIALGEVLESLGRLDEAEKHFRRAIELAPKLSEAHFALARHQRDVGRDADAIDSYRTGLAINVDVNASVALADLLQSSGQVAAGQELRREASELRMRATRSRMRHGLKWMGAGEHEEALGHFDQAIALDARIARAHYGRGYCLVRMRRYEEAVEALRRAMALEPDRREPRVELAWVLAAAPEPSVRDAAEARRLAEQVARETEFGDWRALDVLAAAYAASAQFDRAERAAEMSLQAMGQSDAAARADVRARLELYRNSRPYRLPGRAAPGD